MAKSGARDGIASGAGAHRDDCNRVADLHESNECHCTIGGPPCHLVPVGFLRTAAQLLVRSAKLIDHTDFKTAVSSRNRAFGPPRRTSPNRVAHLMGRPLPSQRFRSKTWRHRNPMRLSCNKVNGLIATFASRHIPTYQQLAFHPRNIFGEKDLSRSGPQVSISIRTGMRR